MSFSYRVISVNELDSTLCNAWRSVQSNRSLFANPYFCPEFTLLAGEIRSDVRVVVIEDRDRVAGFFPYQRSHLGMGKPVAGALSDYHGVVAESGSGWEIEPLMRATNLSVWSFNHLVDDTGRFLPYVNGRTSSPLIDLSSGYLQYVKGRREAGSDYIKKTEGLARKLGREVGELRFSLHESGSEVLQQLIRWKRTQYKESRLPDAFSVPWTSALLRRIAETQTASFAGVCSVLRAGDIIVAVHVGMRSSNVLHYWFPAYDPAFAKFSPGIILLLRMAEALAHMGVGTIDLGEGMSHYKQRLMTGDVPLQIGAFEFPSFLASARRIQRSTESLVDRKRLPSVFGLPLRAIRRIERTLKYR